MVYVFVGDGKGKTSAALGVALRSLLVHKKVVWISWFKSKDWNISEMGLVGIFKKTLRMYWAGEGFFIKSGESEKIGQEIVKKVKTINSVVYDTATPEKHKRAAKNALALAIKILSEKNTDLVVLDEIIQAINEGLLTVKEVVDLIENRGNTHVVLTGHKSSTLLTSKADLVTEMKKIKHPYDSGKLAVRGLDF